MIDGQGFAECRVGAHPFRRPPHEPWPCLRGPGRRGRARSGLNHVRRAARPPTASRFGAGPANRLDRGRDGRDDNAVDIGHFPDISRVRCGIMAREAEQPR